VESGKDSVGERSCVPVTALSVGVTVGAPVPLKVKPGYRLIPLLERTDRDLLLEQCSRTCGGEAVPTRCAANASLPSAVAALMESSWLPHSSEKWRCSCLSSASMSVGRKGDKAFGADAVSGMPDQEKCVLDQRSNMMQAGVLR